MSDKLTSSDSFAHFFTSLQSFYTSRERRATEAAGTRVSVAAEAIAALEDPDDVLLDSHVEEEHTSEEKNSAPFILTADLLQLEQCDIEHSTQKSVTQIEGSTAELSTKNATRHIAEHDDQSQREQCDIEHSTWKLVAQIECSEAELSPKNTAWHGAEHYESGGRFQDRPVSTTQDSLFLKLPPLHQSKWAKPSTPRLAPKLVNMNSNPSNRQGRLQPTGLEPKTASYASVTTASLEASKWATRKIAGQGGAVKPTDQGHTISTPLGGRANSGLDLFGKDSGGRIQENPRRCYTLEFLLRFSKYRRPPPNICWIVRTIRDDTTNPKDKGVAQVSAPNATFRDRNRNRSDSVPTAGILPAKTESLPVAHPIAVGPPPFPTKSSPNVQQSIASSSGGLGQVTNTVGKVFNLPKSRDPKGPPSSTQKGFQR
ncbi:hypothetical protein BGZ74_004422 [Mortierella antarctica]|nr:hypothetical protein BGZ74_004422 [Mortierella antarctica]